ncbi:MAG: aminoglycoside phosphotransferase family protein [Anaerolineae bacterium]|nr:aminoglycoside phosphotransferase family protein [Anaerolineae bacterium]
MTHPPILIDTELVRRLVAGQFPQWAHLPIRPVANGGWDNRTFHLGGSMLVRLPSAAHYREQVAKEQTWLPRLAPHLPLQIPAPLAVGEPAHGYPWAWSIYRWIPGESALTAAVTDRTRFARDLAAFLTALQSIDTCGAPPAGEHNFWRGGPLSVYDRETRDAMVLAGRIDTGRAAAIWEAALAATWEHPPVWVHGDVAAGNLLVQDGKLRAVIDFGCSCVGDPACDLAIAWTYLEGESRAVFRAALPLDPAAWARGRGWVLWKSLITLAGAMDGDARATDAGRVLAQVLADHW